VSAPEDAIVEALATLSSEERATLVRLLQPEEEKRHEGNPKHRPALAVRARELTRTLKARDLARDGRQTSTQLLAACEALRDRVEKMEFVDPL
jgi:hypothetical protein